MKSISAKIILWSIGALLISLGVFLLVAQIVLGRTVFEGLARFNDFQLQQAREIYRGGGAEALSRYLDTLNRSIGMEYHLIDAGGKDLRPERRGPS